MVTKTELCSYTENKIYPGRGRRHIGRDGKTYFFISTKARSLFHQKIKPVKLTWTQAWRRFNKKIRVDELNKKRSRKATRVQKAVVGMSLDEIKRRKAETREDREKSARSRRCKPRRSKRQRLLRLPPPARQFPSRTPPPRQRLPPLPAARSDQ